jgi:hypothetical protein
VKEEMQVSPLRYAPVEMTNLWWVKKKRFAPSREYPTHPPIKLADEWGTPQ